MGPFRCILTALNGLSEEQIMATQGGAARKSGLSGAGAKTQWSRREFMASSLAAGFALAAQPVAAHTIITDTQGLHAEMVKIPTADGDIPGYAARPDKSGPYPVILVVQEIFGLHEHIRDVCRRLAKLGYLAVAPALYARQGDVSQMKDNHEILSKVVSKVPDAQVMSDLDSTLAWAEKSHGDAQRAGITGFCWGGRIVWLYCAHNPKLKAGVAWYGRVVGTPDALKPKNPIDIAGTLTVPVLGLYGAKDTGIPVDTLEAMKEALAHGRSGSELVLYPHAGHAFFADYRPSYNEEAANDGWHKLQAWFGNHGVK
jgi:carboxymethylenebutenolidase